MITAHAWVITMNAERTAYGVLVMSDTMQAVLISAEADKGVVTPSEAGALGHGEGQGNKPHRRQNGDGADPSRLRPSPPRAPMAKS